MSMTGGQVDQVAVPGAVSTAGIGLGLLSAGAQVYDTYKSSETSKYNTNQSIAANRAAAELAFERQKEMWHLQNAYNSPEAQMRRFKEAGLNPMLIYGQGNPGNASSMPQYNPPNYQYHYAAPRYGAAFASILPTLMSVGTWLQDMRLSEARLRSTEAGTGLTLTKDQQAQQLYEYLSQRNPQLLKDMENKLSLFPWQQSVQQSVAEKAWAVVKDLETDYRFKYGHSIFSKDREPEIGGMKKLEQISKLLEQKLGEQKFEKGGYDVELAKAKASWSDFSITDPQSLMQLVLSGVMGMAGQQLRLSTFSKKPSKVTHTQLMKRVGRTSTTKTEYYK